MTHSTTDSTPGSNSEAESNSTTLRLILGDQLNASHSWFREKNPHCIYLIAELKQETGYVRHHVQKVCAFFLAMQAFACALEKAGHRVIHLTLDDTAHCTNLPQLLDQVIADYAITAFEFQRPDEYRLLEQLRTYAADLDLPSREVDTEHFLLPFEELPKEFKAGTAHRMEAFYRRMRKRHDILLDNGKPAGGQWNFDKENRESLKADDLDLLPQPLLFANAAGEVLERLERHRIDTFGQAQQQLIWPITRSQSRQLLDYFCEHLLPNFGRFQDAMTRQTGQRWSLYHSRLSFALNAKILHPRQVIDKAIAAWKADPQRISLAQLEGFVRQILGWREFVRGIYWANMPGYEQLNALDARGKLPGYFWNGDTRMRCLRESIGQSLEYAYAHHIQRLMVIGNFCLIAGLDPDAVDNWYLGVYVDAIQWVELPNTRGMSQFADAGLLASKAYAGSGQYIARMSDYCKECHYKVSQRSGPRSCPFNSLYWHFMLRHRERFEANPRVAMIYRNWERQDDATRAAILTQAQDYLAQLEQL
ncbi:cryptochrome/photolyase family protein [Marinobacterium sp. YM272]|uniref:cryptochrome/photolyase family protein n=1 Tax=Marinobacterium sp. YM272 TaxID=3421654 RepID=UPI003D7FEABC